MALPPVPMPGSYLGAAGIGLVSATFALAWARLKRVSFPLERWPWVIVWSVLGRAFFDAFLRWKALIATTGFPWDARLARLDAWLHGGPAADLLPSSPALLQALDAAYYAWFPVLTLGILWGAWHPEPRVRERLALAFVLVWTVLGILGGTLFASAGPIFTGDSAVGSGTVAMRDALWSAYLAGDPTSISAMPSLHVAVPTLYALAARGLLRWAFAGFAVVIGLGAIALHWHYAVDVYASVLGVLLLWWLVRA
jgi:hypothetical protein